MRAKRINLHGKYDYPLPSSTMPGVGAAPAKVIVAEPLAYLRALMAGAGKPP